MPADMPDARDVIAAALAEDLGVPIPRLAAGPDAGALLARDVSGSLVAEGASFCGAVASRSPGVVCGLHLAQQVFDMLSDASGAPEVAVEPLVSEGTHISRGSDVLAVDGPAAVVFAAERTALDLLMVLSGIATEAAAWQAAAGPSLQVCDTRKTIPGLRLLSKYAVRVGGGTNHRFGLYDMVLIKDNHIQALGGIGRAVSEARAAHPDLSIEVEADSIEQAEEAARAGADMVLLDNMDDSTLARAVKAVRKATPEGSTCLTEASGGISRGRLPALAGLGLDRVSSSVLTFAPPLDFGLDER